MFRSHQLKNGAADVTTLTLAQAYEVQDGFLAGRLKEGAQIVGWKVGCTSAAIRRQFGLTEPISGKLLEPDIFPQDTQVPASSFVDCAVEPELVFRLGTDLEAEVDDHEIISALAGVCAGIELHNYRFWFGAPSLQELIASNGIHAGLVIKRYAIPASQLGSEIRTGLDHGERRSKRPPAGVPRSWEARCDRYNGSPGTPQGGASVCALETSLFLAQRSSW